MQFTALQDFWCEELKSQYTKGMTYTVRAGNDRLAQFVTKWLAAGKVTLGAAAVAATTDAEVRGSGTVEGDTP